MLDEILVPLHHPPNHAPMVTQVRSTLLSASLLVVRERGLETRYFEGVPINLVESLQMLVAGTWMPLAVATAHYTAMDRLGFTAQEAHEIGREVGKKIHASALGTIVRLAHSVGATPWHAVGHYQRLWNRLFVGGDSTVLRLGPKEARLDSFQLPLARFSYFRNAWRGMIAGAGELFCRRMYVTEASHSPTSASFRAAWA